MSHCIPHPKIPKVLKLTHNHHSSEWIGGGRLYSQINITNSQACCYNQHHVFQSMCTWQQCFGSFFIGRLDPDSYSEHGSESRFFYKTIKKLPILKNCIGQLGDIYIGTGTFLLTGSFQHHTQVYCFSKPHFFLMIQQL